MSVTLAVARAQVSLRAQEFLQGTATGGSTTTLVDTTLLQQTDDYWTESTVLMTSGTNAGMSRRVQTFTSSNSTLTLYSAFGASVASTDTYELYRRFSPTDVDLAINRSINIAAPDFREKARAIVTTTADTLQYTFPTGPDFLDRGLIGVEYTTLTDSAHATWPAQRLSRDLYDVLEDFDGTSTVRTLQLRFNPMTNATLRLVYDGILANVSASTDHIHLDLPELEFLYSQAVAELWRIESARTTDAGRKDALEQLARAESFADRLRSSLGMQRKQKPLRRTTFRVTGV